ncbi:MAG: hypothetical protein MZV65_45150 [Chromatiales bacterium]|nr:hypothetical protein [Chromatiales bacterium]
MRKQILIFCGIIAMMFLMVSCAPGTVKIRHQNPAEVFLGNMARMDRADILDRRDIQQVDSPV